MPTLLLPEVSFRLTAVSSSSRSVKTNSELEIATLPRSDRALLSLARALIANPEVLVIHTPGIFFGAVRRDLVMRVLREYVDERGVAMDKIRVERFDCRATESFESLHIRIPLQSCQNSGICSQFFRNSENVELLTSQQFLLCSAKSREKSSKSVQISMKIIEN